MELPKTEAPSLQQRAVKGVFWIGFITIGAKVLSVITTLVLARLLSPADFGLVAIAAIVMNALTIFTDLGLGTAIVHSKHNRIKVGSTALIIMPIMASFLYAITFIFAPTIAQLLGNAEATNVIRLLAVNLIFTSLSIVPSSFMEKDMAFKRKTVPELIPILVYVVVAVALAASTNLGAYSIVWGQVAQGATAMILYWVVSNWRPVFGFSWKVAKELLGYGKHVLGGGVLLFITLNMDNIFVSRILGASALGLYTLAYSIANMPATQVADVLGRVLFPALVEINEDTERVRKNYVRSLKVLVLVTFPILAGLAALSSMFVQLALGSKWEAMAPALAILCIFGAIRVLSGATGSLLLAQGRPKVIFITGVTGLILQFSFLYYALVVSNMGITGAALAVSCGSIVNAMIIFIYVQRFMRFRVAGLVQTTLRYTAPSLIMFAAIAALTIPLPQAWWSLVLLVGVGAVVYTGSFTVLNGFTPIKNMIDIIRHRGRKQLAL